MRRFLLVLLLSGWVWATPLMTEDYPLWVQDAVRTLKERGLVSAGCLPGQALTRADMGPLLQRLVDLQDKELQQYAGKDELQELRRLLEALLEGAADLQQRVEKLQLPEVNE